MADPLSIAASVAGLALLARDVAKGIKQVRSTLKGSGDELNGLYNGVISLYSVLQGASLVMEQMDDQLQRDSKPGDIVFACNDTFEAIHNLLKKHRLDLHDGFARSERNMAYSVSAKPVRRWSGLKQATRWYFDKEEVAKLCEDLEHHKSQLALAMSTDSMTALVEVLRRQTTFSRHLDELRKTQAEIRAGQIQESKRQLSEKQTKMMKDFSEIEPQDALGRHLQLRQQGTGTWFLKGQHFQNFLSEDHASLWLYGIPGAGKSVLSAAVIELINALRTQNVASAFFFCEHDNSDTQGARNILGSLARQLALQNDNSFAELEEFYEKHTSFDKFTANNESLLHLIWSISRKFDTTFIVVDGLDECLESRSGTAQILSELANAENSSIRVLLTSRDEREIRSQLTEFEVAEVNAPISDVRLHVAAQLEAPRFNMVGANNSSLKDEILEYLVEHSGGICQLDYLSSLPSNGKIRKALKQLPPDLHQTYERILLRAIETARGDMSLYLERTLRCIAFAARPLSVTEVSHAIAIEQDDTVFDEPMDMGKILCHYDSLIKEDNGVLTFSHLSIKEFLGTIALDAGPLAKFRLDENCSHAYLAETCLTYLLMENFNQEYTQSEETIHSTIQSSHLYSYASLNWTYHARNSVEEPSRVPYLVERLFEPQKSNNFVLWAYSWIRHYVNVETPSQVHPHIATVNPLHLACICGLYDVIDTLVGKGDDKISCSERPTVKDDPDAVRTAESYRS
ncbi:hypothetical protein SLS58_005604 [Diplodia intermedia]|uniref:Nephrocystin 3-like N-terminal domain-containing protein n=1 Tax=Diplodia intermedia TaxID=856260 RepID=A0ABR3TQT4_9PEZI